MLFHDADHLLDFPVSDCDNRVTIVIPTPKDARRPFWGDIVAHSVSHTLAMELEVPGADTLSILIIFLSITVFKDFSLFLHLSPPFVLDLLD